MKKIILLLCFFSMSAFANWQADVTLGVDGETWKANQAKFEDSKESVLTLGRYMMKLIIKKSKVEKGLDVTYVIHEKKGQQLVLVSKGDEIIEIGPGTNEIYAKGEVNQPNTIITFKFKTK